MVNFRKLTDQANRMKDLIDQQGGSDAVKEKAFRVKDIAMGEGTLSEKAKAAADVAKERPEGAEGSAAADAPGTAEKPSPAGSTETSKES